MNTLTWNLSTAPAQEPEYWLLFVDGFALCSLGNQAPYVGTGAYSCDLTNLDSNVALPSDGAQHTYSVALVGQNSIGPQSVAVPVTLPLQVSTVPTGQPLTPIGQQPTPVVWPEADTVAAS